MIENQLSNKFGEYINGLDIYEKDSSIILSRVVIKDEYRNSGIGSKIMKDLILYADSHNKTIALTPSEDFGGNKNRLISFYKRFGFNLNKGKFKNYEFRELMIREPNISESNNKIKPLIIKYLKQQKGE